MKIPKRFEGLVSITLMAMVMVLLMSFALTGINTGFFSAGFWGRWLRAFLVGFGVSFPVALLVVPVIRRMVSAIVEEEQEVTSSRERGDTAGSTAGW